MRFLILLCSFNLSFVLCGCQVHFGQWKGVELHGLVIESQLWVPSDLFIQNTMAWLRFSPMYWVKMFQWERRVLVKNRRKQIQPCQRWRFIFQNCVNLLNVYPGNPVEEWLWFKHCRRKGIRYRAPGPTKISLYRWVSDSFANMFNQLIAVDLIFVLCSWTSLATHKSIKITLFILV